MAYTISGKGATMIRERLEEIIDDVVQINGKKARDCTDAECDLIIEFYHKLAELQIIAERLRCPGPIDIPRLVIAAYRIAVEAKRIRGNDVPLSEIVYH
jgi:hypothetical protein